MVHIYVYTLSRILTLPKWVVASTIHDEPRWEDLIDTFHDAVADPERWGVAVDKVRRLAREQARAIPVEAAAWRSYASFERGGARILFRAYVLPLVPLPRKEHQFRRRRALFFEHRQRQRSLRLHARISVVGERSKGKQGLLDAWEGRTEPAEVPSG